MLEVPRIRRASRDGTGDAAGLFDGGENFRDVAHPGQNNARNTAIPSPGVKEDGSLFQNETETRPPLISVRAVKSGNRRRTFAMLAGSQQFCARLVEFTGAPCVRIHWRRYQSADEMEEDLQKWIENYADPQVGAGKMIETLMTEIKLNNGEGTGYGLGLFLADHRRRDSLVMNPGAEDTFSARRIRVEFERDRNELVIGFSASNGRTRDVRFQRVP